MFDLGPDQQMQRSFGSAMVRFTARNGPTVLADLAQAGSAKIMLPRSGAAQPEAVFLNTSGGLTGGDRLTYHLTLEAGTRATATTQTAERAYASTGLAAHVQMTARLGAGAHLDWLPQETILFEDANLQRNTEIDLDAGASLLMIESLVLGRRAMGETPRRAQLLDRRMIRRQTRPFWAETLHITPEVLANAASPALLGGAQSAALIALIAADAESAAGRLRALGCHDGAEMAVSGWDGRCIIRITATDSWPLRQQIIRAVTALRTAPMPRVWQC